MRKKKERAGSWGRQPYSPYQEKDDEKIRRFTAIDYAVFATLLVIAIYGCTLLARGELGTYTNNVTVTEPVK